MVAGSGLPLHGRMVPSLNRLYQPRLAALPPLALYSHLAL
jgi:hypothetical protein